MIQLNKDNLFAIEQSYVKEMSQGVKDRYLQEKKKPLVNNPFTNRPIIELFEDGKNNYNQDLVEELLSKPILSAKSKYHTINCYILTGQMVFYGHLSVDTILKEDNKPVNVANRENVRKDFVARFQNDWINAYIARNPDYYKGSIKFEKFIKEIEKDFEELNKKISSIIEYDYLESKTRHYILTNMKVDVCPYCNRQYITSYPTDAGERTTADLDHFLPKAKFTLLSLSLYNFIPSCQICNSRFKLSKKLEILYPYEEGFGKKAYFSIKINSKTNFETLVGGNDSFDLEIEIDKSCKNKKKIKNNVEVFKLNKVYKIHKQYVRELRYKLFARNKTYKTMLADLMSKMGLTPNEMDIFLYGQSLKTTEFTKKPLAKLTRDIIQHNK